MQNWDARWMEMAILVSTWSKDKSRQVGAVIVNDRNVVVSLGWNGMPRGVNDDIEERHQRPLKYKFFSHAEQNAIFNSAAEGHATRGCRIYQQLYPCSICAGAIIQAGLSEVITHEPDWDDLTYAEDFAISKIMFDEAGIVVKFLEGVSPARKSKII